MTQKVEEQTKEGHTQTIEELLTDLENQKLITADERTEIEQTGKVKIGSRTIVFSNPKLPSTEETSPYYPDDSCQYIEGDLEKGLVIADKNGNEYVWIEVPKSITKNASSKEELYNALNQYSIDYKDTWSWGLTNSDIWYDGCGLTKEEYDTNYMSMLNSIKETGGFYIGRYTMGSITPRNKGVGQTNSGIKRDLYPYNWVSVGEAQKICTSYSLGSRKSSLMYDIQYNLVCKYLEVKSPLTKEDIAGDSKNWGNYKDHSFQLDRGKYGVPTENSDIMNWNEYNTNSQQVENGVKKLNEATLLTTGAAEINKQMNIYDFTGNVFSYSLGNYKNGDSGANHYFVIRGGYYADAGSYMAASWNSWGDSANEFKEVGFRNCIF